MPFTLRIQPVAPPGHANAYGETMGLDYAEQWWRLSLFNDWQGNHYTLELSRSYNSVTRAVVWRLHDLSPDQADHLAETVLAKEPGYYQTEAMAESLRMESVL